MQWMGRRESSNTEDGSSGGGRGLALGGGVVGIIAAAIYFFTGIDPSAVLNQANGGGAPQENNQQAIPETPEKKFAKVVFADTEDIWTKLFNDMGKTYDQPKLHFFMNGVNTACGQAGAETGPFYCPGDQKLYIDPTFYDVMEQRLKAPGDFAQAYVIAHEVGHHVQNLIGATSVKPAGETNNQTSVRVELQADCLAGVWGHTARASLKIDDSDLKEAVTAAHAIGDDALGHSKSSDYTHGSSAQRIRWFRRGFDSGDPGQCDTFAVAKYAEL